MKTSEAFQIGTYVWKIDGKEIEYLLVKENLIVPYQKSHIIIFHILCDMGISMFKAQQLKLYKR